jgi:hypothetical protein
MARSEVAYPREGRALLPTVLLPYFGNELVPDELADRAGLPHGRRLRDLGERLWDELPPDAIGALGHHITRVVGGTARNRLFRSHDRVFASSVPLDLLRVSLRARNALVRHGIVVDGIVQPVLLRDLAKTRNVGGLALLQLLAADEDAGSATASIRTDEADAAVAGDGRVKTSRGTGRVDTDARRPSRAVRREAAKLAKRRWGRKLSWRDPRLGVDVNGLVPGALTARAAADLLPEFDYTPAGARQKAEGIRRLLRKADAMARLTIEDELEAILMTLTKTETQRAALRRRFGWDDLPPGTLEDAAKVIGVTRERIRQIESKFKKRIEYSWTPALDRALHIVSGMRFATAREVQDGLREANLTRTDFPLASLIRAAQLFGREVPAVAERDGVLAPADFTKALADVQTVARRLTEHWGTTTVAELTSVLAEKGAALDEDVVRRSLAMIDDVRFLDDEHNWFWISGSKRNRLLNYVQKIMSVAGTIGLSELRDGVGRSHRMRGFRPPRDVLARLCADTGLYKVEDDRVLGTAELPDWHDVLSGNEQLLAEALFEHGPVMRRADLEELVVRDGGMSRASFYIYLTYLPILQRYAPGVYGLRGASISAAEVSALIPPVVRSKVLSDHGWTKDRRPWIVYRLSPASVTTGVLSAPAVLAPVLHGEFSLVTEDKTPIGTLVIEETRMWGVSPFYRRRGVEAGDHLLLVLDLERRVAQIDVGDETIALQYQGGE